MSTDGGTLTHRHERPTVLISAKPRHVPWIESQRFNRNHSGWVELPPTGQARGVTVSQLFSVGFPGTEFVIDGDSLRAVPLDPRAMEHQAVVLEANASTLGPCVEAASQASMAAILFAMVGSLERAQTLLLGALEQLPQSTSHYARNVALVRLAQVHQLGGRLTQARELLEAVVKSCRALDALRPMLDFGLQHLGKILFEQGAYERSLLCLREALSIRESKGNSELIASTRLAIAAVSRMKDAVATE